MQTSVGIDLQDLHLRGPNHNCEPRICDVRLANTTGGWGLGLRFCNEKTTFVKSRHGICNTGGLGAALVLRSLVRICKLEGLHKCKGHVAFSTTLWLGH